MTRIGETLVELVVTMSSRVPRSAETLIRSVGVPADPVVTDGGVVAALVHVLGAVDPGPPGGAVALVLPHQVLADALVLAGTRCALVNIFRTRFSLESHRTPTLVIVDQVHADMVRLASNSLTIVNINTAVGSSEARDTVAVVIRILVLLLVTRPAILTRMGSAGVVQRLAVGAHVPAGAVAGVGVDPVHADPPVKAGGVAALVYVLFAG